MKFSELRNEVGAIIIERKSFLAPVQIIRQIRDPYISCVWGHGPLCYDEIEEAIAASCLVSTPADGRNTRIRDIRRIAYLVIHKASDPITLFSDTSDHVFIWDGFHRLAAAIYRCDSAILATHNNQAWTLAR